MQLMKTLVVSAGAAGAAGLAIVAVPGGDADKHTDRRIAGMELCLKSDLPFFEGVSAKCFSREELLALRDRPLVDMALQPVSVSMSHPSDMSVAPEECRTCRDYGEMSFDGWYALTSRDMRREGYFIRACGLLNALTDAQPAAQSYFADGSPEAEEVAVLARTIRFGEAAVGEDLTVEKTSGALWRISSGAMTIQLHELANADFDNDGVEEIMAFTGGAAAGGTAVFYDAGLLEKDSEGAALTFTPLSYGPEKASGPGF